MGRQPLLSFRICHWSWWNGVLTFYKLKTFCITINIYSGNLLVFMGICVNKNIFTLADLRGGARDACPPWGSKFFHFHAVFSKNSKNNSNFGSWRTPLGKILDPPLIYKSNSFFMKYCNNKNWMFANLRDFPYMTFNWHCDDRQQSYLEIHI